MFWNRKKSRKIPLRAPGPSPWYLRSPNASIRTPSGEWSWRSYDDERTSGISRLISPSGETVLFLEFNCYVLPLNSEHILIWYETGREAEECTIQPKIIFLTLDISKLEAFKNHQLMAQQLRDEKRKVLFQGGSPVEFEFISSVLEGTHVINAPKSFSELGEILVLADYGEVENSSNHWDKMYRAIYSFKFAHDFVEVLPQKWFNEGDYDFDYQWITRVERNSDTGKIVGEGIRLGNFELDDSFTQIGQWLEQDVFYHPEQ